MPSLLALAAPNAYLCSVYQTNHTQAQPGTCYHTFRGSSQPFDVSPCPSDHYTQNISFIVCADVQKNTEYTTTTECQSPTESPVSPAVSPDNHVILFVELPMRSKCMGGKIRGKLRKRGREVSLGRVHLLVRQPSSTQHKQC